MMTKTQFSALFGMMALLVILGFAELASIPSLPDKVVYPSKNFPCTPGQQYYAPNGEPMTCLG